jgi:deoxyribonuclease-4
VAGSKRDRHASIGTGSIGLDPFTALFTSPVTRSVPMVVETLDTQQAADVATLKKLRAAAHGR